MTPGDPSGTLTPRHRRIAAMSMPSRRRPHGRLLAALTLALLSACRPDATGPAPPAPTTEPTVELPPPLDPLPAPASVTTDRFATSDRCAQCHTASAESSAMKDAAGRDVSPVALWRPSMMALAARDPFYLAVFSHELALHEGATTAIERTCARCHAPAASLEHEQTGGHLDFGTLVSGDTPQAHLGRDGVTCSMCHQIADQGLGNSSSFTGGFEVGYDREIFGPHQGPHVDPMQFFVGYTPAFAKHITESAVCATCHTVIVRPVDDDGVPTGSEVIEQAPYLEWRNSDYNDEAGGAKATACTACHLPTADEDGNPIVTRIARTGEPISERSPYGRHILVGGNAYMLRLLDDNESWASTGLGPGELEEAAERVEAHLDQAVTLSIVSALRDGEQLEVDVSLVNRAGHKFPTGYPTRRAWIHLRVTQGATVLFESGAFDESGALVDGTTRLDDAGTILPHRDTVTTSSQVAIYEAILVDAAGAPTHLALGADRYDKDNRLLPSGWSSTHPLADLIGPIGTDGDGDFVAGGDVVHYRIDDLPAGALEVEAVLRYQSIPPATIDTLSEVPTPAAVRFSQMARALPPAPIEMARATTTVP